MKLPGASIVLAAVALAGHGTPALAEVRRLRTESVYKSEAKAGARRLPVVMKGDPNERYDPMLGLDEDRRDLEGHALVFGSLSVPIISFSFSFYLPLFSMSPITVVPAGSMPLSGSMSLPMSMPSTTTTTSTAAATTTSTTTSTTTTTTSTTETPVAIPCSFCPDGVTAGADSVIPGSNGTTCAAAKFWSTTLEDASEDCATVQIVEGLCCPGGPGEPEAPCDFCAGGITAEEGFELPDSDGMTCESVALFAAAIESTAMECLDVKFGEILCCPPVLDNPCEFCNSGITAGEDFAIPNADGTTCGMAALYAGTLDGADEMCSTTKLAEAICCPTFTNVCSFCPGGLEVVPEYALPVEEGTTCGMALGFAPGISADDEMCATIQLAEQFCCPGGVEIGDPSEMSMSMTMGPTAAPSKSPVASIATPAPTRSPTKEPVEGAPTPSSAVAWKASLLFSLTVASAGLQLL